jgi:hypothetical protein
MYRIYFDANEGDARGRFDLGMRVILYDSEELEVEAVLEYDQKYQRWMADPIWSTLKRLNES